jgi:hypothetical protein
MRRRFTAPLSQLETPARGLLTVVRSSDLPSAPDESEPIVNAFNQLEQHLDGLRDVGKRLALVSASLRSSAREMKHSVERLETPLPDVSAVTAVPSIPMDERRAHLRLLKTVA